MSLGHKAKQKGFVSIDDAYDTPIIVDSANEENEPSSNQQPKAKAIISTIPTKQNKPIKRTRYMNKSQMTPYMKTHGTHMVETQMPELLGRGLKILSYEETILQNK